MVIDKKGLMIVLSSPSGVGKTTLTKKLAENNSHFVISISYTTRKPRPNEIDGKHYHFVTSKKFNDLIKKNDFYEYAEIFDNYYGTHKKTVNELLSKKKDVLFDIDWQGTQQLSKFKELNLLKIFILPPSKEELKKRLIQRNQDKLDVVEERLKAYDADSAHKKDYDFVVINDNLENCFKEVEKIILMKKNKK